MRALPSTTRLTQRSPRGHPLKPLSLWERLREGTRRGAPVGRSYLFSQREKIEMRGRLVTTNGHSKPPALSLSPSGGD